MLPLYFVTTIILKSFHSCNGRWLTWFPNGYVGNTHGVWPFYVFLYTWVTCGLIFFWIRRHPHPVWSIILRISKVLILHFMKYGWKDSYGYIGNSRRVWPILLKSQYHWFVWLFCFHCSNSHDIVLKTRASFEITQAAFTIFFS